jgi:TolA-binding protein
MRLITLCKYIALTLSMKCKEGLKHRLSEISGTIHELIVLIYMSAKNLTMSGTVLFIFSCRLFLLIAVMSVCFMDCTKPRSVIDRIKTEQPPKSSVHDTASNKTVKDGMQKNDSSINADGLSPASVLMIKACDNYLEINPSSVKTAEVLLIKASVLYNSGKMKYSRDVYKKVIEIEPGGPHSIEATRMIAQSYYEEKRFDEAQDWYRKLKDRAGEGGDRQEAIVRIAESIFKLAEAYEQQQRFQDAAKEYERTALEFPDSKIADVSLLDAGLAYEKLMDWARAITMYQRVMQKYSGSKLLPKTLFRTAKCYEKLLQWNNAGETYLRVVANYPQSDLGPVALYNAGFSFESGGKLEAAAATFEKMAQLYPKADEVADVLFKAGEIYGKLKDWPGVTRVNKEFSLRFGNDMNRAIQAQCMIGIALYMQNRPADAEAQLQQTISRYEKLNNPSSSNRYYAAKAEFTIAEINLEEMNRIALTLPRETYKKQLSRKTEVLEKAIDHYTKAVAFKISEWTTRSIFQIGQAYEDFATGIFRQERPRNMSLDERMALELGIAKAVEQYFVDKAAHYHEQNIKLGIKEKIEDKYILQSRKKITSLPLMAGENYLALVDIIRNSVNIQKLDGFALIAKKLDMLQKIAPFQEKAINLFLKCLEMGSSYQENDEFYTRACGLITNLSYTVGETYADVASISRDAPIPSSFDAYESFVYKTKLLKQIEIYEDKGLENYMKTVKIAEAYKIDDDYVKKTRLKIPELLFWRGRCYDILCQLTVNDPPYPKNMQSGEKEEYQARFEEIALKFQENALDVYKTILSYSEKHYATGEFVTHAYIRLFQNSPSGYGAKKEKIDTAVITSGPDWKCTIDSVPGWNSIDFNDQSWRIVQRVNQDKSVSFGGFPSTVPAGIWYGDGDPKSIQNYKPAGRIFVRRTFYNKQTAINALLYAATQGQMEIFFNGFKLTADTSQALISGNAVPFNLSGKMREGKNVIALCVFSGNGNLYGIYPYITYTTTGYDYLPQPPGFTEPLTASVAAEGNYVFPAMKNFHEVKRQGGKERQ